MFARLRRHIADLRAKQKTPQHSAHQLHLAAATLLLEVVRADYARDPAELGAVRGALARAFALNDDELDALLQLAHAEAAESTSLYPYTRTVNAEFSDAEKAQLIGDLWLVAHADGNLDKYEEHMIRKIAERLYVPHGEFIRRKLLARRQD